MRRTRWRDVSPCEACGARDWIRPSFFTQLLAWLRLGGPWGAGPRTCRRCGERVEIGGGFSARSLSPARSIPLRLALAPLWILLAIRRSRTRVPVPMIYLLATAVGLVLGIALDFASGLAWWIGPVSVIAVVWLMFLASARKNLRGIGREFARMTTPQLAMRASKRAMEAAFRRPPFPLYGLPPGWAGRRFLGGHGGDGRSVTSLTLAHGDPFDEDGVELRVECSIREYDSIELRRREAFEGLVRDTRRPPADVAPDEFFAWVHRSEREIRELPEPAWERLDIRVDGRPIPFDVLREGRRWVAVARLDDSFVMLDGRALSPRDVELVRVDDVAPYIDGTTALETGGRAAHGH